MSIFWFAAGVMVVGGLAWIVPVLLKREPGAAAPSRRDHAVFAYEQRLAELESDHRDGVLDDEQLDDARDDLARELLYDTRAPEPELRTGPAGSPLSAVLVVLAVPAIALVMYTELGSPEGLLVEGKGPVRAQAAADPHRGVPGAPSVAPSSSDAAAAASAMPSVEAMVTSLAERLAEDPEDGEGWMMLGRSYTVLGRLEEAKEALAQAYARIPENTDAVAAYAEVLGRVDGNRLAGRPAELLAEALAIDPQHPKSLWLAGIAAMQSGKRGAAIERWEALKRTGALNVEETATLDRFIAEAGGAAPAAAANVPTAAPASSGAAATAPVGDAPAAAAAADQTTTQTAQSVSVTVRVTIAPALAARIQPGDSLFVFARAESGPPMPLAVQRMRAGDLPVTVTLDESMAMMPQMTLATFPRVVIGARISRSGNAAPSPGDLQGLSGPVSPAASPAIDLQISEVIGG